MYRSEMGNRIIQGWGDLSGKVCENMENPENSERGGKKKKKEKKGGGAGEILTPQ